MPTEAQQRVDAARAALGEHLRTHYWACHGGWDSHIAWSIEAERLANLLANLEGQRQALAVLDYIEQWCERDDNPDADEDDLAMLLGKLHARVLAGAFKEAE